jgi:WD40 repeat protein
VASVSWSDPIVRLWDAATGKPLPLSLPHDSWIRSCAFASDGRLLISGGFGAVRLLDASTGAEQRRFVVTDRKTGKQNQEILVSHLSADGKRLAVVSTDQKQSQLTLWDARTGERLARRPFGGGLNSHFTPDGKGVTVASRECLAIEDTRTGQHLAVIPGDLGHPVAFSSDGQLAAVGTRKTEPGPHPGWRPLGVRVIEMASREELFHIDGRIEFAALSADGRRLVTADPEALRLWDVRTGELLLRWPWPADSVRHPLLTPIHSLAFLPNDRALVTGMNDGTLLVWDMTPPTPKADLAQHLDCKQLDAAWADLADDARRAYRAIYTLAASPEQALPFLAKHLRPVAVVEAKQVDKLLADLDSEQFTVRQAAAKQLTDMGTQIELALWRVLESKPSLEVRNRVQAIQEALRGVPPVATLRTLRAIRVLEHIGTPEARDVLRRIVTGAPGARQTREAAAALKRLEHRVSEK